MPKSSQYWKEYNQKRREYQKQLMRKRRAEIKVANSLEVANACSLVANRQKVANISRVANLVANKTKTKKVANIFQNKLLETKDTHLTQLIHQYRTQTNYSCASTCTHSYCNNCWYFANDQLINYKGLSD